MTGDKQFDPAHASAHGYTSENWEAVSDNPEWTEQDFAKAKPFAEAFPDLTASIKRARGRPVSANPKEQLTLRLDADVVEKFRATGKGWQSRINEALRQAKV